ncbi:hypothetical protein [Rubinisphaera italica]|uniref:Uncharacterized protein n=1 Tax=Rubinisphaera italica TaxID=2527969 RepID=A0A5C5XPK9_9PLAN|nr:hypothetical protein [Rubinisphaera italica]TWT64401.1 hypothetical protein Pan54_51630 [Rubinisphaera italica]
MPKAQPTILIRSEDAEHPKLSRLRRAVKVEVGDAKAVDRPWVVWATGLSRTWLIEKLDKGGQVLVMPPWMDGGFAGLPPSREVNAPDRPLMLGDESYAVSASAGIDPSPAWQGHGYFFESKVAWLVSHEPFAGAGQAWLSTAELLVASPSTRPRDAKLLTAAIVECLQARCRVKTPQATNSNAVPVDVPTDFAAEDAPYLLAAAGLPADVEVEAAAQFINRRLSVEPDTAKIERIMKHPTVTAELSQPIGQREQLARVIDSLGFRSFRLEIEENAV